MTNIKYLFGALLALLTLGGCGNDSDYLIENNPDEFAIYPIAIPVGADGGTYELKVTGNEAWTAELSNSNSSAASWCTFTFLSDKVVFH